MTCCSATGCSCSIDAAPDERVARPAGASGCIARPTTPGSARSTGTGWRCCGRASGGGRRCPTSCSPMVEERIVASRSAIPASGRERVARELARAKWGGIVVSPNGVWKVSAPPRPEHPRQAARRWSPATRAPYEPPRDPGPSAHIEVERPGELVGIDCFYVGRLQGTKGAIWQLTAIDVASSFAWAELVICHSRATRPRAADLQARPPRRRRPAARPAGGSSACSPTTATSSAPRLPRPRSRELEGTPHPHPRRPPADQRPRRSAAPDDPRRVLAPRLRPLPPPPLHRPQARPRHLPRYYNHDRVHHGRLTRGRIPADIVYGARKMEPR